MPRAASVPLPEEQAVIPQVEVARAPKKPGGHRDARIAKRLSDFTARWQTAIIAVVMVAAVAGLIGVTVHLISLRRAQERYAAELRQGREAEAAGDGANAKKYYQAACAEWSGGQEARQALAKIVADERRKKEEEALRLKAEVDAKKQEEEAKREREKEIKRQRKEAAARVANRAEKPAIAPAASQITLAEYNQRVDEIKRQFPFVPVSRWKGIKFIFLETPKKLQGYGYQEFKGGTGEFGQPTYTEAVGRTGTVIAAVEDTLWKLTLKMDDNGQDYTFTAYGDSVDDIAPVVDIRKAQALWKGKTLWPVRADAFVSYDADTEEFQTIGHSKFAPVRVIDVVPGWYNHEPVRIIVETASGKRGFADCQLSGTNVSGRLRKYSQFFDLFFVEDPRGLYPWDERTWTAIENGHVFVGMTREQARLSWGAPKDVNRTTTAGGIHEQWVYGNGNYLYFEDGKLTAIQN